MDKDWRITIIVDLKWAYSLLVSTLLLSFRISGYEVDELEGERTMEFNRACGDFLQVFSEEEQRRYTS